LKFLLQEVVFPKKNAKISHEM